MSNEELKEYIIETVDKINDYFVLEIIFNIVMKYYHKIH